MSTALSSTRPMGSLVLMPNTLDHGTAQQVGLRDLLPDGALQRAAGLQHWVVENAKSARAFLKRVDGLVPLALPLQQIDIRELPRLPKSAPPKRTPQLSGQRATHSSEQSPWAALLAPALAGADLGLLSEAGLPAVADPGGDLVAQAHAVGLRVEAWSGPSSLMMALACSGLGGQNFAFVGYLPQDPGLRAARIRELESWSKRTGQTQIAIETPYRNTAVMQALLETLQPQTRLSVASGLTLPCGWNRSAAVASWRVQAPAALSADIPAVFAWLA